MPKFQAESAVKTLVEVADYQQRVIDQLTTIASHLIGSDVATVKASALAEALSLSQKSSGLLQILRKNVLED